MTSRHLLSVTASLALAAAGFLAPAFITQGSAALASPTVTTLASVPAQAPTSMTPGTRAQTQAVTMPARRIRIRSHSNNPTITIISWILAILIVGGGILVRFAIFKATQRNSTPPTAFQWPPVRRDRKQLRNPWNRLRHCGNRIRYGWNRLWKRWNRIRNPWSRLRHCGSRIRNRSGRGTARLPGIRHRGLRQPAGRPGTLRNRILSLSP